MSKRDSMQSQMVTLGAGNYALTAGQDYGTGEDKWRLAPEGACLLYVEEFVKTIAPIVWHDKRAAHSESSGVTSIPASSLLAPLSVRVRDLD